MKLDVTYISAFLCNVQERSGCLPSLDKFHITPERYYTVAIFKPGTRVNRVAIVKVQNILQRTRFASMFM